MSAVVICCLIVGAAGSWLVLSGAVRSRRDPIRWALAGHPMESLHRGSSASVLDRLLATWDARWGMGCRDQSLAVLRRGAEDHRRRQVRAVGAGTVVGGLIALLSGGAPTGLVWALAAVPVALATVEWDLNRAAVRRRTQLAAQVTAASEYLALCATAGLTAAESFDRTAHYVDAPMGSWLTALVADVRSGSSLEQSLQRTATAMGVPEFDRLTDTVLTAAGRGTPLAATLVAQAQDARGAHHARLLEQAGRAEVAMLVPIVALVLPAVVAVAVYPGLLSLLSM